MGLLGSGGGQPIGQPTRRHGTAKELAPRDDRRARQALGHARLAGPSPAALEGVGAA